MDTYISTIYSSLTDTNDAADDYPIQISYKHSILDTYISTVSSAFEYAKQYSDVEPYIAAIEHSNCYSIDTSYWYTFEDTHCCSKYYSVGVTIIIAFDESNDYTYLNTIDISNTLS